MQQEDTPTITKPKFVITDQIIRFSFFIIICILTFFLYKSFGTDSEVLNENRSIFKWMLTQWKFRDFENNWVMLLLSLYVIYKNRATLAATEKKSSFVGILVVAVSLLIHFLGYRTQLPRLSIASIVGVIWGSAYALWGWQTAKNLLFPAGYALLCFTCSLLAEVTMPLRLTASSFATWLLQGAGIEAFRQGTVVFSKAGGGFTFDVADACSGLRSLSVMAALAAPYAYFTIDGFYKKWFLFAMSLPLAMLANSIRIFTLGVVAEWIGMKLAMQLYHDLSGHLVFIISILLLIATGSIINRIGAPKTNHKLHRRFKKENSSNDENNETEEQNDEHK